jgi:hypothetical protein
MESPPPNDYYVRNENETLRTVSVPTSAEVVWYPQFGDPSSEESTTYPDWLDGLKERDFGVGVWLDIDSGEIVRINEQLVP